MEYSGKSENVRARIKPTAKYWGARYPNQECDAIIYAPDVNPQLNTEQLNPPLPKWQSLPLEDIEIISR